MHQTKEHENTYNIDIIEDSSRIIVKEQFTIFNNGQNA